MPTTFTSLIMFALLVMPGVAYVTRRQREMPYQDRSVFRETATVAVAGIAFNLAVLVPVLAAAAVWPHAVIDVGALIADSKDYLAVHWWRVGLWALLALSATAGLALLAARKPAKLHSSDSSSWDRLFNEWRRGLDIRLGCELDDGSWIEGDLADYNPTTVESGDRDLILEQPVMYRPRGHAESVPYGTQGSVCLSARHIRVMFVNYLPERVTAPSKAEADSEPGALAEEAA